MQNESQGADAAAAEIINASQYELVGQSEDLSRQKSWPRWFYRTVTFLLYSMVLLFPVCFGGVHEKTLLIAHTLAFGLLGATLIIDRGNLAQILRAPRLSAYTFWGLCLMFGYALAQTLLFSTLQAPHPVLGLTGFNANPLGAEATVMAVLFFICTYTLTLFWLEQSELNARRLKTLLVLSALLVSLIALSHWFYDNGKLFWNFEPDNLFISERARWPFVNSNSLAQFLLPLFFLCAGQAINQGRSITRQGAKTKEKNKSLAHLVSSQRLQSKMAQLISLCAVMISLLLCIVGSLSRGSWSALALTLVVFSLAERFLPGRRDPAAAALTSRDERHASLPHERRRSSYTGVKKRNSQLEEKLLRFLPYVRPLLIVTLVILLYLFMRGQAQELFVRRLDYGLMYSREDMRFQLYADSWPMIKQHLFWGVGLGGWAAVYPKYMHPGLSGIVPVYLHSDPLQFLAEWGLCAVLLFGALVIFGLIKLYRSLAALVEPARVTALSLVCGLLALILASFVDFPFHIPAINFYCAILLALLAHVVDKKNKQSSEPISGY